MKPILAITMGDPAGIGPEIILKSLLLPETYEQCRPLVTGDAKVMQWTADKLGYDIKIRAIKEVSEARFEQGIVDVIDLECIDMDSFQPGVVQVQCGHAAFISVIKDIPQVVECYNISGEYDYMLKIHSPNMKYYNEFIINVLGTIDSIGSILSSFVMAEIKNTRALSL